jgi:hypothetical protein|tara:strand:+ start:32 stop:232 length:201 start_codon:yes stop_codon:yes gene_type:complete
MPIHNQIFQHYRDKEKKEILDRLVFVDWSQTNKDCEIWRDPVTNKHYVIKVQITRDFDNMKEKEDV